MKLLSTLFSAVLVMALGLGSCNAQPVAAPPRPDSATAPHKMGVVGRFLIANDANEALAPRTVSFGQVFAAGSVRVGDSLNVVVDGRDLPTQLDAKALHHDGSVRHAVMSVALPRMEIGHSLQAQIVNRPKGPAARPPRYAPMPKLDVVVTLKGAGGQARAVTISLPAAAERTRAAAPDLWLQGPLAEERRIEADVDPRLQVVFDVFRPTVGPARVDVVFHHDWATAQQGDDIVYDVDIRLDGASVYRAPGVRHYPYATWHRVIWTDGRPQPRIAPDLGGLIAAAAVPRYDQAFDVSDEVKGMIEAAAGELESRPMSAGMVVTEMPTSGGRMDIGPLPTWAVVDLLEGDALTRKALLLNADAAGAAPWHIRERSTRGPLTIDKYPDLWLDDRASHPKPLPEPFSKISNGWTLDTSHQPSLSYLPYVITGSRYYKDELAQQAAFVLLSYDDGYRGKEGGYILGEDGQAWSTVRGLAWSLRTVANAAYVLPADDPLQPYFDAKLRGNLAKLVELFVEERSLRSAGEMEGWIPGAYRPEWAAAPWQQGFLTVVLGWINDMGYPDSGRLIGWTNNFLTGLFTNQARGLDPYYGTAYILAVRDPQSGRPLNSWATAAKDSGFASKPRKEIEDVWNFYGLIMRAGLGSAYSATGSPDTARAYRYVSAELARTRNAAAHGDPTFAIVPSRALPAR